MVENVRFGEALSQRWPMSKSAALGRVQLMTFSTIQTAVTVRKVGLGPNRSFAVVGLYVFRLPSCAIYDFLRGIKCGINFVMKN